MKEIKKAVCRYIFSEDLPLEAKKLNVIFLCGIFFASVAVIIRILTGANPYLIFVALAIALVSVFLMYLCNRFHLYTVCTWITIIVVCDMLLPSVYFLLGGITSSSVAYFVLSLVLIFLLSGGRSGAAFFVTHLMVVFACYFLAYRYPNLLIHPPPYRGLLAYLDYIQSFLIVGGSISVIIKFQNKISSTEKEKEALVRAELLQQDKLLHAVNDVAAILFSPDTDQFEDFLQKGMEILARCVDVDRVFIWKTRIIDSDIYHEPIVQWVNDPGWRVSDPGDLHSLIEGGPDWETIFFRRFSINGPHSSFAPELRDLLAPYHAQSTLAVPIFLQDHPWGFVSFDDCRRERYFSSLEENILRSGSLLLADATIRNETTENLIYAREEALASTQAKSKFLARMSHEIRTPLNGILGLSEVELQKDLPRETQLNLEKVYHSGSHLLEIVNDILDISKIESGNFEIFPVEYDFPAMVSDTVQLNMVRIGIKAIEFKVEVDETIPRRLYGDEVRVKQILNNLLSNAFKYTEEGEVRFSAGWEEGEGGVALLSFTVGDTGRGIRKEDMEKLFSEYTQFEAAANRKIEGTGLGLSITKGLAEKMGGEIRAESEYGKGSEFRVKVPQGIVDRKGIGGRVVENLRKFRFTFGRDRNRGDNFIRSRMPYGRVLVVDDIQTNLDVMRGLLMPYGLKVDMVSSGREAVEAVGRERYDLVFMDHMMPEMDGIEATRIIRKEIDSEHAREVPVVALTANAIAGNREMFLASGFNDFISKPIDIKRLDLVLNRWIRDRQGAEAREGAGEKEEAREEKEEAAERDAEGAAAAGEEEWRWLLGHPAVEGVDFQAAYELYGGSGGYLSILRSFVTHVPELVEKMDRDAVASLGGYAIEVHGLKGSCNAICAGEAAGLALELEAAAKEGRGEQVKGRHGELKAAVLGLRERLKGLLEEWEAGRAAAGGKEAREEPDRKLLELLSRAAGGFSYNETEEILKELERFRYGRGEDLVVWLREQAESFDYEAMHRRLEEFLGT